MKRLLLLPLGLLAAVQFATAGVIITEEAEQSGGPMPGKTQLTITVSGDRARVDVGKEISSIVDSKTGAVTSLMHSQKIAMQLPEGALDAIKKKTTQSKPKLDLKPTGNKKTINGFNCEEYKGTIEGMKVAFWITHEVENQKEILAQIGKLSGGNDPFHAALEGGADFPGFPIRSTLSSPQAGTSTMTVISVRNEDVPATTFEIPPDYKTMDMPKVSNPGGGAPSMPVKSDGN
jgi:hypothetical protein